MNNRYLKYSVPVFVIVVTANTLRSYADELCIGNYQSEAAAIVQLDRFRKTFVNREQWENRASRTRLQILNKTGLGSVGTFEDRMNHMPLNPTIHSTRKYNGYQVRSIIFESLPGFFVYGTLYEPLGPSDPGSKFAGVLCPHGHGREPNGGGRYRPNNQLRCATLARMGAVVLSYDMVGFGDSEKLGWKHASKQTLPLQLWSSLRAIDYLLDRMDIDPSRIGVTGASGGGTQTFLLAAIDDRVSVSVPTVMVSAHFFGGCICESGHPIHKTNHHETNNVDIAACAAPRPQLLISVGGDWTKNTPKVEFPYLRDVYSLYDAEQNAENAHFEDEQHDFGPSKQAALFSFFAKHLNLDASKADPTKVTIEDHTEMAVTNAEHPLPKNAIPPNAPVALPLAIASQK